MTSVLATYPLDIVRGRLTAQGGATSTQYTGMVDALSSIVRNEGVAGLYRGIAPTLIGIAPYVGINFLVYESLKERAPVEPGATGPSALWLAGCGAAAGTTGQTVAYPADVLRRRFQLQALSEATTKYSGVVGAVVTIVREEGIRGLYKGCES